MEWWKKMRQLRGDRKAWSVAHEAGMAESQYSRYERGHYPDAKISTLERLSKGIGCSVKDFFDDKPIQKKYVREITHEEARIVGAWKELPKKLQVFVLDMAEELKAMNDRKVQPRKAVRNYRDEGKRGKSSKAG